MKELPKYFVISQEIISRIRSGELVPGMQVPSEHTIIKAYSVSNTTARKALAEIESSGWARRIKGKGTFVSSTGVNRTAGRILSFTKNMIQAGLTPRTEVLHRCVAPKGYSAVINGRRYTLRGPAYKIHRLRFGNDIPMLLEIRYINMNLCPEVEQDEFDGSLYELYERKYGLRLQEVRQMLSTILLDAGTKDFFNITETVPGFLVDGVTFCGNEIILSMEKSIYRGDKYRFAVTAT